MSRPDLLIAAHQLERAAEEYLTATGSPNTKEGRALEDALDLLREAISAELEDLDLESDI